jgi:hypothetical protein
MKQEILDGDVCPPQTSLRIENFHQIVIQEHSFATGKETQRILLDPQVLTDFIIEKLYKMTNKTNEGFCSAGSIDSKQTLYQIGTYSVTHTACFLLFCHFAKAIHIL